MSDSAVVPNGTDISSPVYLELVERYQKYGQQTAEVLVRLAETLLEAKKRLGDAELREFCNEVGLKHNGSTFRKLQRIAEEASRFEPFFDRMPNSWTTVYVLAKLDKNDFDRITKDQRFSATMSANEISVVLHGEPEHSDQLSRDWTIDLSSFDPPKKIEICKQLTKLVDEYGLKYELGAQLKKDLGPKKPANVLDLLRE